MAPPDPGELAYEALMVFWPTLAQWIQQERVALQARSRLDAAARDWMTLRP